MNTITNNPDGAPEPVWNVVKIAGSEPHLDTEGIPVIKEAHLDDDDRRVDHDVDNGVANYHTARQKVEDDPRFRQAVARVMGGESVPVQKKRHPSHRGGRAYPEPSDSELEGYRTMSRLGPTTPEEDEVDFRGIELNKAMGEFIKRPDVRMMSDSERKIAVAAFIEGYKNRQQTSH